MLMRAIIASLALHLVLLALIPPFAASDGTQAVETISFVHMLRVAIEHPVARRAPAVAAQAPARAPVAHTPKRIARLTAAHPAKRAVPSSSPVAAAPIVAQERAGTAVATVKSDAPQIVPSAKAQPQQDAAPPARQSLGGFMPLGADEPSPVLDPAVRKALAALNVHVTLTVSVDANGHTKAVAFAPAIDAAIEDTIRSMLAPATWDPAVCGAGMPCAANATIRL
jgi:hypothetical protein